MPEKDIGLTFDTSAFEAGMAKIGQGMAGFQKSVGNMAKNVSKGITSAVAKIGLVAVAFKGVQNVLKNMPEVGQAFGIAKDIFMKNLLYPLRQAVFPWLQKMVDWVRNNRTMFVKWGATLANIFNTIVGAVQKVIDIGKKMVSTFIGFINKVFGTSIRDLHDLLNILTFKFSVVITFLSGLAKPLLKTFADVATALTEKLAGPLSSIFSDLTNWIISLGGAFAEGFGPHVEGIINAIGKIASGLADIYHSLIGSESALKIWKSVFSFIGNVVGTTLKVAFEAIAAAIDLISKGIKALQDFFESSGFQEFLNNVNGVVNNIGGFFKGIGEFAGQVFGGEEEAKRKGTTKVQDVIITKKGEVIQTSPEDMIIATKGQAGGGKTINVSIDFSGFSVNVPNATPAQAESFAGNIVEQIRIQLQSELTRIGAF